MQKKYWNISRKQNSSTWVLSVEEGIPLDGYPSLKDVLAEAAAKKIPEESLSAPAILTKKLETAKSAPGEAFNFPITRDPSFDVRLSITHDRMMAELYIRKAQDAPHSLDLKLISTVLNTSKIKFDDADMLKAKLYEFRDSPNMELVGFVVAKGIPPGSGGENKIQDRVKWLEGDERLMYQRRIIAWEEKNPAKADVSHSVLPRAASPNVKIAFVVKEDMVLEFVQSKTGNPGKDVYGVKIPGLPGRNPLIHLDETLSQEKDGIRANQHGAFLLETINGSVYARIVPYCDAFVDVQISPNNMEAVLSATPETGGGEPLTVNLVMRELRKKGIGVDVDERLLASFVQTVKNSGRESKILVARGKPPVPPGAPVIEWASPEQAGHIVSKGEKILSYRISESGQDGVDIMGRPVPFQNIPPEPVPKHDASVEEKEQGGWICFFARLSGEVVKKGSNISVSDKKEINGDLSSDDKIENFPGVLVVNGNVKKGATVKSTGLLTVNGHVGAAIVTGDDSVVVNGGIKGDKLGTIWAKNRIDVAFAENACLLAGGDIHAEKYCFQCTIKTNARLVIKGNPGILLGGTLHSRAGIEVSQLGSPKRLRTMVSFGQDYIVADQIEVSERELKEIKSGIEEVDNQMKAVPSDSPAIQELRKKKFNLLKHRDRLTIKIFTLKEVFEQHYPSQIKVEGNVWPGVLLESHGRYFEVHEKLSRVVFSFDQSSGQIVYSPIENSGGFSL